MLFILNLGAKCVFWSTDSPNFPAIFFQLKISNILAYWLSQAGTSPNMAINNCSQNQSKMDQQEKCSLSSSSLLYRSKHQTNTRNSVHGRIISYLRYTPISIVPQTHSYIHSRIRLHWSTATLYEKSPSSNLLIQIRLTN